MSSKIWPVEFGTPRTKHKIKVYTPTASFWWQQGKEFSYFEARIQTVIIREMNEAYKVALH